MLDPYNTQLPRKVQKIIYSARASSLPLSNPPSPELSLPCPRSRLHSQGKTEPRDTCPLICLILAS